MKKIAFLISAGRAAFWPFTRIKHIPAIRSAQGNVIQAYLFIIPCLTDQKIYSAANKAKDLGAEILGFDLNFSDWLQSKKGESLDNLGLPICNGNIFTAWSIFEAVYRVSRAKKINLMDATLVIFGKNKQVASLCARKFADYVNNFTVFKPGDNPESAIDNADIIINVDSLGDMAVDIDRLKPKPSALIFELYGCAGKATNQHKGRKDIIFVNTGLIKAPFPDKLCLYPTLPKGIISASLAETILLTMEDKTITYAGSETINPDKIEEIADIAAGCGFEVWLPEAPLN